MTIGEAAKILKEMHRSAPPGEKYAMIHLFGIKYAEQIKGMSLSKLLSLAEMRESYATEIYKGIRLAPHVEEKT